jgi:hypothetical protein
MGLVLSKVGAIEKVVAIVGIPIGDAVGVPVGSDVVLLEEVVDDDLVTMGYNILECKKYKQRITPNPLMTSILMIMITCFIVSNEILDVVVLVVYELCI